MERELRQMIANKPILNSLYSLHPISEFRPIIYLLMKSVFKFFTIAIKFYCLFLVIFKVFFLICEFYF